MPAERLAAASLALLLLPSTRLLAASGASAKRRELGAIQKELEAARRQIEDFKKQEESLDRDASQLRSRGAQAQKKMSQLQSRVRDAEARKLELKARLGSLGQVGGVWRSSLETDLALYQRGLASRNDFFERSGLWAEHFQRATIAEKSQLISGLKGASRTTELAAAQTRRTAEQLHSKEAEARQEHEASQHEYERKMAAIAETKQKEKETLARVRELEENAAAMTKLIRTLGKTTRTKKPGVVGKLDVPRNSLPWPADGSVVRSFGRQRNPELDAVVVNQGILLATQPAAPVKSVGPGKVIFAGPFRSYGQVLIVDHGANFFTIYGELGRMLKGKGDRVGSGETIARAGAGSGGRGSVYLEIRRGTEALDPLAWLSKK